ncbi:MAG: cell division protein ZapA [Bdellovibrionales bacterium]|nr:cell division protein ZapA [Bdellovibrionales bacterium]
MSRSLNSSSRNGAELELDVLGERLRIRASEDMDFVGEVAELVKVRLQEANRRLAGTNNKSRVLLLALLDLAEEYVKSKRRLVNQRSKISAKLAEARLVLGRAGGSSSSDATEA